MRYYCVLKSLLDLLIFSHQNLKGRYTFFALFNFQDAVAHLLMSFFIIPQILYFVNPFSEVFSKFSSLRPVSLRQLKYYITSKVFCQAFSLSFSKNFFKWSLLFKAALILYHFHSFLSSAFSKFLLKSFS